MEGLSVVWQATPSLEGSDTHSHIFGSLPLDSGGTIVCIANCSCVVVIWGGGGGGVKHAFKHRYNMQGLKTG